MTLLADAAGSQARFLVKVEAEGLQLLKTTPEATVTQAPWGPQTKMQIQKLVQFSPVPEPSKQYSQVTSSEHLFPLWGKVLFYF